MLQPADSHPSVHARVPRQRENLSPRPGTGKLLVEGSRKQRSPSEIVGFAFHGVVGSRRVNDIHESQPLPIMKENIPRFMEEREPEDIGPSVTQA
jgi:hypothetical protein